MSTSATHTTSVRARLRPVGVISSVLKACSDAPKQGSEGAPDAWLDVHAWAAAGLHGLVVGDEIIVITWLHQARRDVLQHLARDGTARRHGVAPGSPGVSS